MKLPTELTKKLKPVTDIYLEKRRYDSAIEDLLKMKAEFPDFDIVDYYLGVCYINKDQYRDGVKRLEAVRKSKQLGLIQLTQVNMILGLIHTEKNKLDQAELYFKKAIEINNTSSMSYSALGYVYYLRRQYDTAIQNFRRALQLDPNNAGAHNNLGYTMAEIGVNLNEAVRECRKAVMLNANSAAYHDSLGWALFISGDYPESAKELRRALEIAPAEQVIQEHLQKALDKRDHSK